MCVGLLDDPATLQAQLAHLKAQHIERKIPDNYFEVSAFGFSCSSHCQHFSWPFSGGFNFLVPFYLSLTE